MVETAKHERERGIRGKKTRNSRKAETPHFTSLQFREFRVFFPRIPRSLLGSGLALLLIVPLAAGLIPVKPLQAQEPGEYQVKAAFLVNFMRLVEWPADSFSDGGAPIIIGVIGEDPFGSSIDQMIIGKSVQGRQVAVKRMKWGQNLKACHMLFIGSSERRRYAQILGDLKGASVLTVGETDRFTDQGGMINFVLEGQRVRFEINADAAEQSRLTLSSKLLSLAKTVKGGQRGARN